jgi:hypothetical protein
MTRELEPDNAGARNSLTGFPKSSHEEEKTGGDSAFAAFAPGARTE